MQDYQILLDAQQRQHELRQEAAAYRLVREQDRAAKPGLLRRALHAVGVLLVSLGVSLQRLQMSSPAAASAHSHRVKHPSL